MSGIEPGDLRVTVEYTGSTAVLRVAGELDIFTAPRLASALEEAQLAAADIAVEASDLEFIDSTGLHLLIAAHERAASDGLAFVVAGAGDATRRALEVSGLDTVLTVVPDIDAALAAAVAHTAVA